MLKACNSNKLIDAPDDDGRTALFLAATGDHVSVVLTLLLDLVNLLLCSSFPCNPIFGLLS